MLQNSHKSFSMYFVCRNHEKKDVKFLHINKIKQKSAMVGLAKKSTEKSTEKNFKNNLRVSIIFFSMRTHVYPE